MKDFCDEDFYDCEYEVDDFLGNLMTNFSNSEIENYADRIKEFNLHFSSFENTIYIDHKNVTDIFGNDISKSNSALRYTDYEAWGKWNKLFND